MRDEVGLLDDALERRRSVPSSRGHCYDHSVKADHRLKKVKS
jgi:hypothetical protein